MADIKIRKKLNTTIKTLDRTSIVGSKLKENLININEKAKGNYERSESPSQEYAINKIQEKAKNGSKYGIYKVKRLGKKNLNNTINNLKNTKENLNKAKNNIKKVKDNVRRIKKVSEQAIKKTKQSIRIAKKSIKTAKKTIKTAHKTAKVTIKTTKKVAKVGVKMTKATIKLSIKAIQVAIKITIAIVKAIIAAIQALIAAIIAGGWVAVIIIVVICLIAMICYSIYGIFFSSENEVGDKTMSSVISELNNEFTDKIIDIQSNNEHDEYQINGNRAEWKDILSIYTVYISNGNEETDVITLNDDKINKLKSIFWEMNTITSDIKEVEKEIEITDDKGNVKKEKVKRKTLYINITSKTVEEMTQKYNFNNKQKLQLAELQKEEYNSMWSSVIYGSSNGSTDIVEVALAQVGNVGGQPYWSWYGFNNRVEWCACFVSWCANECGYIESGIIPKFASVNVEGVPWFKTVGLWKDGGYSPKRRRYNIF